MRQRPYQQILLPEAVTQVLLEGVQREHQGCERPRYLINSEIGPNSSICLS